MTCQSRTGTQAFQPQRFPLDPQWRPFIKNNNKEQSQKQKQVEAPINYLLKRFHFTNAIQGWTQLTSEQVLLHLQQILSTHSGRMSAILLSPSSSPCMRPVDTYASVYLECTSPRPSPSKVLAAERKKERKGIENETKKENFKVKNQTIACLAEPCGTTLALGALHDVTTNLAEAGHSGTLFSCLSPKN